VNTRPSDRHGGDELVVSEGRLRLRLSYHEGRLLVANAEGDPLDPAAAEVLMALGGDAPWWLYAVEGLEAVDRWAPFDVDALRRAVKALGQSPQHQIGVARSTTDQAVLVGLAGGGVVQVALNPAITPVEWDILRAHRDGSVWARALRLATVLPAALGDHRDPQTRLRVSRNPVCPPDVLARLSGDFDVQVQAEVAANPNTEAKVLQALLVDGTDAVRRAVASNPHASRRTLRRCLRDKSATIRAAAAGNPTLPKWRTALLVADKRSPVRRSLATRPDTTARRLAWIDRCSRRDQPPWQAMIRAQLRNHPNATPRLVSHLAELDRWTSSAPQVDAAQTTTGRPGVPMGRRIAAPSPVEAIVILVAVGTSMVLIVGLIIGDFRDVVAPMVALGGLELILLVRCRTVRPKMRVAKSRRADGVPKDQRLRPFPRWERPLTVAVVLTVAIVSNIYDQGPSSPTSGLDSPLLSLPNLPLGLDPQTIVDLPATAAFQKVANDIASPLSPPRARAAAGDGLALEQLASSASLVLGQFPSSSFFGILAEDYVGLAETLQAVDRGTTAQRWNQQEPAIAKALQRVAADS
jgi:hypothetical protein